MKIEEFRKELQHVIQKALAYLDDEEVANELHKTCGTIVLDKLERGKAKIKVRGGQKEK